MSFEGYYQILCEKSHYSQLDAYAMVDSADRSKWRCSKLVDSKKCGAKFVVANLVDDTNDDQAGKLGVVELVQETRIKCNLGHEHIVNDATYRFESEVI